MATAPKKSSKIPAAKKAMKPVAGKKPVVSARGVIEENVRIKLKGGMTVDVNISIGSTPKVGSGPKPKKDQIFLVSRISPDQVMTISAELLMATAGIVVGSGQGPRTGGN